MNILYLSISYVPSRRASAVQVMNMCSAFAQNGHSVTLVTKDCPTRVETTSLSDHQFYGLAPNFELLKIPRPETKGGGVVFQVGVAKVLHDRKATTDLVFSRDLQAAVLASTIGLPTVFEAHGLPASKVAFHRLVNAPSFVRVVFISEALKREYMNEGLVVPQEKVVVAHDGASVSTIVRSQDATKSRATVGYVGSLYPGRGVEVLIDVARRVGECDYLVVGGQDDAVRALKDKGLPKNVSLAGFVPPGKLDAWYRKMDILLMPYSDQGVSTASGGETSRWMSPLKMFEYMATGIPLISSDLPVLREVLTHEHDALFVGARDLDGWCAAVRRLAYSPSERQRLGGNARETLLAEYAWDARARAVLGEPTSLAA